MAVTRIDSPVKVRKVERKSVNMGLKSAGSWNTDSIALTGYQTAPQAIAIGNGAYLCSPNVVSVTKDSVTVGGYMMAYGYCAFDVLLVEFY